MSKYAEYMVIGHYSSGGEDEVIYYHGDDLDAADAEYQRQLGYDIDYPDHTGRDTLLIVGLPETYETLLAQAEDGYDGYDGHHEVLDNNATIIRQHDRRET